MYESIKYFLQHDLDAFTGVDTGIKGDERYQYTKHDGSLVKCGSKDQFFHEGGADFLGYDNKDSLTAFPLKKFDTLLSAMEHFNMEWHSAVAHLLVNTQYELFGNEMLKCTSFFESEATWQLFNTIVAENQIAHGYKEYRLGAFYRVL